MNNQSLLSQELSNIIQTKRLSEEYRLAAVRSLRYHSTSEICSEYKISLRTLYRWKKKWEDTKSLERKPISGRPLKLNSSENNYLLGLYAEKPSITNDQVTHLVGVK